MPQPATRPLSERQTTVTELPVRSDAFASGVSWPAVIGGAFVSSSLALILLSLGTGLGLASVSPWSNSGVSAATIGKAAIAWLILTQIMASSMGGYLAGRLRTKWTQVHTDEVYFRDTAHGFLVWAVGLVITVAFLASAATSLAGGAAARNNLATSSVNSADTTVNPNAYFVDKLFRANGTAAERNDAASRVETERIFVRAIHEGAISSADQNYLAQEVAGKTGLNQMEAEKRVSNIFQEAQRSADSTRKAFAHLSLWLFVALLSGAFCASYAGTIGGKQRDHVPV